MQRDREPVAGFLRIEEAEMLSELLDSQGIEVWVEGAVASVLAPALPGIGGGAKLLVRTADAVRARDIIAHSGVFRGDEGAAADIPEQEWRRAPPPGDGPQAGGAGLDGGRKTFFGYPVVVVALVVAATVLWLLAGRS